MVNRVRAKAGGKSILIELDPSDSPNTVSQFLACLPFSVMMHVWGKEAYSDPCPVSMPEENPRSEVSLHDAAYWPEGRVVCLFYGPTPLGGMVPASPVNVIGRILSPDGRILDAIDGSRADYALA